MWLSVDKRVCARSGESAPHSWLVPPRQRADITSYVRQCHHLLIYRRFAEHSTALLVGPPSARRDTTCRPNALAGTTAGTA